MKIGKIRWLLARFIFFIGKKLYEIKTEGQENLAFVREYLEKEGSVILAFNHISFDDPFVLLAAFYRGSDRFKKIVIPVSRKHWDELPLGILMRLSPIVGLRPVPVVQHYQRDKAPLKKIVSGDLRFFRMAKAILGEVGGMVLVAPEGHRGEGTSQSFQGGISHLVDMTVKKGFKTLVFPVEMRVENGANRGFNFGRKFIVCFGNPLLARELQKAPGKTRQESLVDIKEKLSVN